MGVDENHNQCGTWTMDNSNQAPSFPSKPSHQANGTGYLYDRHLDMSTSRPFDFLVPYTYVISTRSHKARIVLNLEPTPVSKKPEQLKFLSVVW